MRNVLITVANFLLVIVLLLEIFKLEKKYEKNMHEYQLNLEWRTIEIYKAGKFVGCYESDPDSTCPLDTILANYNR